MSAFRLDALGQVLALIDVENRIFAHHRDQASVGFFTVGVLDLQLLDEIDLRSVLAFAHVAAGLDCLLEREEPRRWPAAIASKP